MAGWASVPELFKEECVQAVQEGKSTAAVEALREKAQDATDAELADLFEQMAQLPLREDWPYVEPNDLPAIQQQSDTVTPAKWDGSPDQLLDRLHGAWLGRCAGCALGKPVEPFMEPRGKLSSRQRLQTYLQAIDEKEWPIRDYIPARSPAEDETGKVCCEPSTREHIAYMETDDDIRYTVLGQVLLEKQGLDFQPADVMQGWLQYLGASMVCTAETQAYINLTSRYVFHHGSLRTRDIDWDWVTNHQNPYREWIGAAIRVDSYGYACPGNPTLAAELAWRDARISHTKNGIYGAMFNAAMIAQAFVTMEPEQIVRSGLACIPKQSRLHEAMLWTMECCDRFDRDARQFEAVFDEIESKLGHYHAAHTINNAAVVVAALLLGGTDFGKVITLAVMGGWDTDCNGATAGSICGAMLGAKALPTHWTARLNDTLYSAIPGYHPISISTCAEQSLRIIKAGEED